MIQLSPNWDNNGYYYPESKMHGFVVNLMSGDGGANEGQVLFTATTGPVRVDRSSTDYTFDHAHESATAGYYQVLMQPWGINAEFTSLTRTGMAKFTFPAGQQSNILVPISYANNQVYASHIHVLDSQTVSGDVTSKAFYGDYRIKVYFVMAFSKPFADHGTWTDTNISDGSSDASQDSEKEPVIGFYGSYLASDSPQEIDIRIGISYVDAQGAMNNLNAEMPTNSSFAHYRALATAAWNKELGLIDVSGGTSAHSRIFYTALYHSELAPQVADDADGRYRGYDNEVHSVDSGHAHFYQTFSGWDIYRSEIPLLSIIEPSRTQDMAQSIVDMSKQLGYIDRWPQLYVPTNVMNGEPLTICLSYIWQVGLHNFDINSAYHAMGLQSIEGDPYTHIGVYQGSGEEQNGEFLKEDDSVSSALEYDAAFAALGHLAVALNKDADANFLFSRAAQYREMYNPDTGFLQGKLPNGEWDPTFGQYTEGNQFIYLWFVPEDIQGLVSLIGGAPEFNRRLDEFFADNQYDPTNEPDLQAPFLYDYINRPWKTQKLVAETADNCFTDTPGGIAGGGNDDLGTMSAWYILSQLGFYFVDPGVPYVEVCTPRFTKAILHLSNGQPGSPARLFEIDAPKAAVLNEYIESASLNNLPLTKPWFAASNIFNGGNWSVTVGSEPNTAWGSSPFDRPYSLSTGFNPRPANGISTTLVPDGRTAAVSWKYTTDKPTDGWFLPNFDDSSWKSGDGGFGTDDVGVTARTVWDSDDIWMRRSFDLASVPRNPELVIYHDQSVDLYINGKLVQHVDGWTHSYDTVQLPDDAIASMHTGKNELAIHVNHLGDGRHFADAGLIDLAWPDSEK